MLKVYDISLGRTLILIGLSSLMSNYKRKPDDSELLKLISDYGEENPTNGLDLKMAIIYKSHRWDCGKKIVRLYHKLRLLVIRKRRFRRLVEPAVPLAQTIVENVTWSMEFISDSLNNGGKLRVLNVLEDYICECLGYDVARSLRVERLTCTLNDLRDFCDKLHKKHIDNGPEYRTNTLALWAQKHQVKLQFVEPGKPTQNSYYERVQREYHTEVLYACLFESIKQTWDETVKPQYTYHPKVRWIQKWTKRLSSSKNTAN